LAPECKVLATQGFCHDLREQILLLETLETGEQSDCNWGGVRRDRFRRGAVARTRCAGERCRERPNSVYVYIVRRHEHTGEYLHSITIDLEQQTVKDDQGFLAHFDIDPFRKYCLLNGLDDIGLTLRHEKALDSFEQKHNAAFWLAPKPAALATTPTETR